MFDTREGNALQELAKNGAEPNAFTSNAMTAYYFDSTEHFEENLRILLSFVSIPYFTDESVAKEQGIIGQEIRMIEDNPDGGEYFPYYRQDALRLPQGVLHPGQYDPYRGGGCGSHPYGGPCQPGAAQAQRPYH